MLGKESRLDLFEWGRGLCRFVSFDNNIFRIAVDKLQTMEYNTNVHYSSVDSREFERL